MIEKRLIYNTHALVAPILASVVILVAVFSTALTQADGPNQVGLVVVHGDGNVATRCIEFEENEISGYDVLDRSGLDLNIEPSGGMGVTVCRIDNEGCTFPQEPCFCQCMGGGSSCVYWSYWHLDSDSWQYSGAGASYHSVSHGDVEGWVWGLGTITEATPPPVIPFDEICALPTSTPAPTDTATPEPSPTPTDTPEPTNTPNLPDIAYFNADRGTINAGESVTLSWDLSDAKAAYLRYEEVEEGVIAPGSKTVSPSTTTVYILIAGNDGGETTAEVTITVIRVTDTPVPTDTPLAASVPTAPHALLPSATPSPASQAVTEPGSTPSPTQLSDTPIPPVQLAEPTSTRLPPPSPMPTVTPAATSTPAPVVAVTPALRSQQEARPPSLLRDTPQESGPGISVMVLAVIGVIALLSGLAGMLLLLLAVRQDIR